MGLSVVPSSVLPSFQSFLEIGSLVFTETQHGLRTQHGHAMLCVNKDEFWKKKIFCSKHGENGAEMGQN